MLVVWNEGRVCWLFADVVSGHEKDSVAPWEKQGTRSALHTSSLSSRNTGDLTAWGNSGKALSEEALNWALKDRQDFDR